MRRRRLDRFERSGPAFYERVASGFRALAAEEPERWVVVDGDRPMEAVAVEVRKAVHARLGL
jgi:dTMP kinase